MVRIGVAALVLGVLAAAGRAELVVQTVEKPPEGKNVFLSHTVQDTSGVTSVRFTPAEDKEKAKTLRIGGKEVEYFSRDRDLGQVFTAPKGGPIRLEAITLRTGPVKGKIGEGVKGAAVSLQFFAVTGTPTVHDNGTTKEKVVSWNDDPRADDYLTGETYTSLRVVRGGVLPRTLDTDQYLRWELTGDDRITLEPGKRYAFLVMLDKPAKGGTFTLANKYSFKYDPASGSHGIRREGALAEPWKEGDWTTRENCSLPTDFAKRTAIPPSTWGRPDVDTWRNLVFFLEGTPK